MANATVASPPLASNSRIGNERVGIIATLSLCALFLAGMRWWTQSQPAQGDQCVYAIAGHELLNGRRLYADLWDHKPPAVHVTYAVAELIAGYGPQQIYLLEMAALLITLLGLYRAGTLLGGPRAGVCAGLFWALGALFPNWEGYQPTTETFVNALLVWSYYLICRLCSAPAWWRACAFGAAVGAASLYKHVAVAPAVFFAIAYILGAARADGERWLRLRHMALAAAVSASFWVACIAYFWFRGSFADFYSDVFVYNRAYAGSMLQNIMLGSFGVHYKKSYLIVVALPCLLLPYFAGPRMSRAQRNGWLILAGWAVGCHIGVALAGRWFEHYFELWMPVYALAGGALWAVLSSAMFAKRSAWRWALLALVLAPLVTRFVFDVRYDVAPWLVYEPDSDEYWNRYEPRTAGLAINRLLLPGERLYALGPPGQSAPLYFYSRQRPASGVFYEYPLHHDRPGASQLEERIIRDLDQDPPDLIVLLKVSYLPALEGKPAAFAQHLVDWISPRYSRCPLDVPARYVCYARRGSALAQRYADRETPGPINFPSSYRETP
jgi:hypothetical protein